MIEIQGLRKKFGAIEAVRDVCFRATDGTVVRLLGPNGAGKTTTLRMLSGLMRPDAGTIHVDNIDVVANPIGAQMHMGLLPDSRGLYPRLTPVEHIEYFGRLHCIDGPALTARTKLLLTRLGLNELVFHVLTTARIMKMGAARWRCGTFLVSHAAARRSTLDWSGCCDSEPDN